MKKHILSQNHAFAIRLFMCQDESDNKPKDESFRLFWIKPVTNEPGLSTVIHLRIGWSVMHYLQNERKL